MLILPTPTLHTSTSAKHLCHNDNLPNKNCVHELKYPPPPPPQHIMLHNVKLKEYFSRIINCTAKSRRTESVGLPFQQSARTEWIRICQWHGRPQRPGPPRGLSVPLLLDPATPNRTKSAHTSSLSIPTWNTQQAITLYSDLKHPTGHHSLLRPETPNRPSLSSPPSNTQHFITLYSDLKHPTGHHSLLHPQTPNSSSLSIPTWNTQQAITLFSTLKHPTVHHSLLHPETPNSSSLSSPPWNTQQWQHNQHTVHPSSLSLAGAARSTIFVITFVMTKRVFVMTKHIFCCDKSTLAMTKLLSKQNYVCSGKHTFVMTKLSSWQIFVMAKLHLSWQAHFCHNKRRVLSQQTHVFVMTNTCLLQQAYFCPNKRCVLSWQTRVCHDKHVFVMTKRLLQHKWYLWQLPPMTRPHPPPPPLQHPAAAKQHTVHHPPLTLQHPTVAKTHHWTSVPGNTTLTSQSVQLSCQQTIHHCPFDQETEQTCYINKQFITVLLTRRLSRHATSTNSSSLSFWPGDWADMLHQQTVHHCPFDQETEQTCYINKQFITVLLTRRLSRHATSTNSSSLSFWPGDWADMLHQQTVHHCPFDQETEQTCYINKQFITVLLTRRLSRHATSTNSSSLSFWPGDWADMLHQQTVHHCPFDQETEQTCYINKQFITVLLTRRLSRHATSTNSSSLSFWPGDWADMLHQQTVHHCPLCMTL